MARIKQAESVIELRTLRDLRAAKGEWTTRLMPTTARRPTIAATAQIATLASSGFTRAVTPAPQENVVGIGIGEKISDGRHTGIWAVKFFVRLKFPDSALTSRHRLPKAIGGMPVDVEETGLFRRLGSAAARRAVAAATPNPQTKIRPAPPGSSVGFADPSHKFVMAGTFGALVSDRAGTYILSNNHVLADESRLAPGAPIFQPGLLDGGNADTDKIAELTRFGALQSSGANRVDGAIAKVDRATLVTKEILSIGAPHGTTPAQIDMTVHKFGRTTSYTVGRITSIDTDVTVQYETGSYTFTGQIIVVGLNGQPFSAAGDSGSLILQRPSNQAVGLLFAGSPTHTIANHIEEVLQALKVTLA
jgi:S1-C subfamily serine protease